MTSFERPLSSRYSSAAIFHGAGMPFQLERLSVPSLQPAEILVRVICCTICGSDLHTVLGRRSSPTPSILGHEAIGVVEAIGPSERRDLFDLTGRQLRVGDRITWSIVASCGSCFFCNRGLSQKCEKLFKYGHEQLTADRIPSGGLSEFCVLRPGTHVLGLPHDLPDFVACPANCATATVAAAFRLAGVVAGQTVVLQGAGMLGLTAAAMAHHARAAQVIVLDPDHRRLALAREFGADVTLDPSAHPERLPSAIRDVSEGRGADVVMEFSGQPESFEHGVPLLRTGGLYLLAGAVFSSRAANIDPESIVRRMICIRGIHNYTPADLATALTFLLRCHKQYPFRKLIETMFPLSGVQEAFDYASKYRPLRVAVVMNLGAEKAYKNRT